MPDRFEFSRLPVEDMELFAYEGGIEWLFDQLDVELERELLGCCTNTKPGEDEPAQTYFLERVTVAEDTRDVAQHGAELYACTCPAYRYQQIPKPDHVRRGVVGLEGIGECKHLQAYKKRSRKHADTPDEQASLADRLGIDGGGDA